MDLNDTFRVEISIAEAINFANQHPEAARSLFAKAAERQQQHQKTGLVHSVRKLIDDNYKAKWLDARNVHDMVGIVAAADKWKQRPAELPQAKVARQHATFPVQQQQKAMEQVPPLRAHDYPQFATPTVAVNRADQVVADMRKAFDKPRARVKGMSL